MGGRLDTSAGCDIQQGDFDGRRSDIDTERIHRFSVIDYILTKVRKHSDIPSKNWQRQLFYRKKRIAIFVFLTF
jgi:hypothetical protein